MLSGFSSSVEIIFAVEEDELTGEIVSATGETALSRRW